jgi:hypothetical protein
MAGACVPAYALSTLFARPGLFFNVIGGLAAAIQLIAMGLLFKDLLRIAPTLAPKFSPTAKRMSLLIFAGLIVKSLLQLLSAHPDIAVMAYELRPVVIAYLHLVLVGVITFFLITWYFEMGLLKPPPARLAIASFLVGFLGSQVCLVLSPWWSRITTSEFTAANAIFGFSVFMVVGAFLLLLSFRWGRFQTSAHLLQDLPLEQT